MTTKTNDWKAANDSFLRQIHKNEQENPRNTVSITEGDSVLTDIQEFEILQGGYIVYPLFDNKSKVLVPPLKISQYKILLEVNKIDMSNLDIQSLDKIFSIFSKLILDKDKKPMTQEQLEGLLIVEDINVLISVMTYGVVNAKSILKKKAVLVEEIYQFVETAGAVLQTTS